MGIKVVSDILHIKILGIQGMSDILHLHIEILSIQGVSDILLYTKYTGCEYLTN